MLTPTMSTALRWLGTNEEDRRVRASLLGQWQDAEGSIYTLTPGRHDSTINVLTARPNGEERFTFALVGCCDSAAFWGKPGRRFSCDLTDLPSRVTWRRGGAAFFWSKIQ
jgi:hypothetical protein